MLDLILRERYWTDGKARAAFKAFLRVIHGLDLQPWDDSGCWDERYTPFSLFDDAGQVVSSVCVYSMPALVAGRRTRVAQISGVGTLEPFRRRGLASRLTKTALAFADGEHEAVFLFADDEAVDFYAHRGFSPAAVHGLRLPLPSPTGAAPPEPRDARDPAVFAELRRLAFERDPLSDEFFTFTPELTLFHALQRAGGLAFEPGSGAWLLLERRGERIVLRDALALRPPDGAALLAALAATGAREVEFRFPVDRLGLTEPRAVAIDGAGAMLRGPAIWPRPLTIPATAWA